MPPNAPHREELLHSGAKLSYRDGYNGTTVDSILAASGVTKGSFYHHFGSKEAFGFAVLDRYDAYQLDMLETWSARSDLSVPERLTGYYTALVDRLGESDWSASCLVSKFSNELAVGSPAYRGRLAMSMRSWCAGPRVLLAEGRAASSRTRVDSAASSEASSRPTCRQAAAPRAVAPHRAGGTLRLRLPRHDG